MTDCCDCRMPETTTVKGCRVKAISTTRLMNAGLMSVMVSQNTCLWEDLKCPTTIRSGSKDGVVPDLYYGTTAYHLIADLAFWVYMRFHLYPRLMPLPSPLRTLDVPGETST